jgi:dTDP-4-dehydrorhamnose 3,5-epimerase
MDLGSQDIATVTPDGDRLGALIEGVNLRRATTHPDERGELTEIFNPAWGILPEPAIYIYQTMLRPRRIKGWVYHKLQHDRFFLTTGHLKIVLYDPRETSPTRGVVNEVFLTERNRGLLSIPPYVVHAVQNIGEVDAVWINMPTVAYNHAEPDKIRIPLGAPEIPYSFDRGAGW